MHKALVHLCLLTFAILGDSREVLRNARRIAKATKELIKTEQHNDRVLLKFEMLLSPVWRARVLKDLGGVKALKRWERSSDRAAKRRAGITILKPHASPAQREARAINLAKAKEALREKRTKRPRSFYSDTHPNVFKDPCKVDFEGQFRLAPIARRPRILKTKVEGETRWLNSGIGETREPKTRVVSVRYNKINPIPLWPQDFAKVEEFEAAEERNASKSSTSPPYASSCNSSHEMHSVRNDRKRMNTENEKDEGFKPP